MLSVAAVIGLLRKRATYVRYAAILFCTISLCFIGCGGGGGQSAPTNPGTPAGVSTIRELRYRNPQKLAEVMAEVNTKRRLVRILPSVNTVSRWIEDAKKLQPLIRY